MAFLIPRIFLFLLMIHVLTSPLWAEDWRNLAPGLELREFVVPDQFGDLAGEQGVLAVLRIDTNRYDLALGAALGTGQAMSMPEWVSQSGFAAAINAGMFRADDRMRSTGYMRDVQTLVSDFLHPDYGAFLAFQPKAAGLPRVRWVDRKLDADWESIFTHYDGILQNYRLISRNRENLWSQSGRRHSAAAIAMDQAGHLLFIHCRPRLTLQEFAQALLDLPLDIAGAMYVEGGADAAMYVQANGFIGRWVGEYQSDFFQGSNKNFWPAPNVLGITAR